MDRLNVDLGERSYDIVFSDSYDGLAAELTGVGMPKRMLIVTDSNVYPLYAEEVINALSAVGCETVVCVIPAGEENKNIDTIQYICRAALEAGLDRKSMIAALGGGVVGDMAGFAAAIYMRGIEFIQLPTTLLSQSDSSVGGKTGFDFAGCKNILGAFHQPRLVYINVSTLRTLPEREFVSGMGEVIKHGIIRDAAFFEFLENNSADAKALGTDTLIKMGITNCSIKADVVKNDERESGLRAILNFGHTIGHAVESAFNFRRTHGECVALGMVGAAYIAYKRNMIEKCTLERIERVLDIYGFDLNCELPPVDEIMQYMDKDKKKIEGRVKFVLPSKIGAVEFVTDVGKDEITEAIAYIGKGNRN